jgi:ribosomal-protein-alanine N-acetyltransferase
MVFEYIETARLRLRKIDESVYDYLFTQSNEEQIKAFFGINTEAEIAKERNRFEKRLNSYNKVYIGFHLLDKENDAVLGWFGFNTWYTEHNRAEIGYYLVDDASKRKGYMSEVIEAMLAYGFREMNLNRIEALTSHENEASQGLLKKFGFQYEGCLRGHYLKNGVFEDSLMFALLKSEYEQSR